MTAAVKKHALMYLLAALLLTLLLGVGLPRLAFQPGMPIPSVEGGQVILPPEEDLPQVGVSLNYFLVIFLLLLAAAMLIMLVYRLIKGIHWKQLLSDFLSYLLVLLIVGGILSLVVFLLPKSEGSTLAAPLSVPTAIQTTPLGAVPSGLIWLVGIFLLSIVLLLGAWMIFSKHPQPLDFLEVEAENARQALLAGQDLRDVILRCYQRMSQSLQEERRIEREAFMTTGEFERLLTEKGAPPDPIHQLTQLFEAVRYGRWQPNPGDEEKALHCLDAILEYSRQARQVG